MPNGDRAIVDLDKLQRYCLHSAHRRGRHKARVFRAALGISSADAAMLRDMLLRGAATDDATPGKTDRHGTRHTLDLVVARAERSAVVRTHWIVRQGEDVPRFVSCYVV